MQVLKEYTTDDLRITVVYRARCFRSEEEVAKFRKMAKGEADSGELMTLEYILNTFKADLVRRGKLLKDQEISSLDLALTILDEYMQYPLPSAWIPINYCMLGKLFPATNVLFEKIC